MIDLKPIPFDATQKLYLLKADADQQAAVHPEQFREARLSQERSDEPPSPDSELWVELPREYLIAGKTPDGRTLHRLALTTDAGLGKSYNLLWMRYAFSGEGSKLGAFVIPIGSLSPKDGFSIDTLVQSFMTAAGYSEGERTKLQWSLERLRKRGELILLFDGLDMANEESVQVLADILSPASQWSACRIIIAGRPFALERHWTKLFAVPDWNFVQIAEFDSEQQRRALGKLPSGEDRYDRIPAEARSILTTPRVLECLRPLQEAELAQLGTVGDVYWQAATYMLNKALTNSVAQGDTVDSFKWDRLLAVLGALAFTMYGQTEADEETGELRPNLDRVHHRDMTPFLLEVLGRLEKLNLRFTEKLFFDEFIKELSRLNEILHHGWFDVKNVGAKGEDLLWRNASLQEFFAAYWVTRWGTPEDAAQLRAWVVDPLTDRNRGFYWFWRYASEMPEDAVSPGTKKPPRAWIDAMSPLYDGSAAPIRSTEFIYRSWERMAAWKAPPLDVFQQEFRDIRAGKYGPEKNQLAENLVAVGPREAKHGFIPLVNSGMALDTGTFEMGAPEGENPDGDGRGDEQDNPLHEVTLSPFLLHRYCVTNVEYEMFAPNHMNHRWDGGDHPLTAKPTKDNFCPVVNVTWYDAFCFCKWLGKLRYAGKEYEIVLPTEARWEYGCRCGQKTPFTFDGSRAGAECEADFCNFDGRRPWPDRKDENGLYRGYSLAVDELTANRWGFFHMHGNVWEWCEDWFSEEFYRAKAASGPDPENRERAFHRVLRGGGWSSDGRGCRSANRSRGGPGFRDHDGGFRLAAVPALEPSKASRA